MDKSKKKLLVSLLLVLSLLLSMVPAASFAATQSMVPVYLPVVKDLSDTESHSIGKRFPAWDWEKRRRRQFDDRLYRTTLGL